MTEKSNKDQQSAEPRKLYRIPEQGMIAGVAAGVADYFQVDVILIRVLFVVAVFITNGFAILAYFAMALIMPTTERKVIKAQDIGENINHQVNQAMDNLQAARVRNWLGAGLVLLGTWLLLGIFWPTWLEVRWDVLWPVILVVVGLILLRQSRR